ncbi:MAG: hypothetical protein BGO12_00830 [Verrucomicrobia bacterium 61-8]|nr:hypothetical protein [Verrucomicrobiota bacterium]OJV07496.1 MAG: hypothetical protein BGO12_00830 [Verrucomicrobia bacterium 61-8]
MSRRLLHLSLFAAVSVMLGACASSGPSVNPAITSAVSSRGVNSGTYLKMSHGQVLDYDDILNLVQKDVPSNIIVGYLASTRKVYDFNTAQLQGLKSAGASPQVINFLSESQGFYGKTTPAQVARTKGEQADRYYRTPYYQDEQPFAYNAPIVDDWYDSGYEESLYSPFSFN